MPPLADGPPTCVRASGTSLSRLSRRPLQRSLHELGFLLSAGSAAACLILWAFLIRANSLANDTSMNAAAQALLVALAAASTLVPERTSALLAVASSRTAEEISWRNGLMKDGAMVERAARTSVVVMDKTGTMTSEEMKCTKVALGNEVVLVGNEEEEFGVKCDEFGGKCAGICKGYAMRKVAELCALSTQAGLRKGPNERRAWVAGDRMEGALVGLAEKIAVKNGMAKIGTGVMPFTCEKRKEHAVVQFLPFRAALKLSAACVDGSQVVVKGAPEEVIGRCSCAMNCDGSKKPIDSTGRDALVEELNKMTREGLRVIAFAMKDLDESEKKEDLGVSDLVDLVFVAFVGMIDSTREEVTEVFQGAWEQKIGIVIVSGDHEETVKWCCVSAGLDIESKSYDAKTFLSYPPQTRTQILEEGMKRGIIFSRASPKEKLIIVRILQHAGHVVAFAGDGLDDKLALQQADLSIVMGLNGHHETKAVSDLILIDDSLKVILSSIEQGRALEANMRACVSFLLALFLSQFAALLVCAYFGLLDMLGWQHLLLLSILSRPPSFGIAMYPDDPSFIRRYKQHSHDRRMVTAWTIVLYVFISLYIGFACTVPLIFHSGLESQPDLTSLFNSNLAVSLNSLRQSSSQMASSAKKSVRSVLLSVLVLSQLILALSTSTGGSSLFASTKLLKRPFVLLGVASSGICYSLILLFSKPREYLELAPLSFTEMVLVFQLAVPVLLIEESMKLLRALPLGRTQ